LQVFANICIDVSTFSLLFEQMQHNIGICVTCISNLKKSYLKVPPTVCTCCSYLFESTCRCKFYII